MSDVEPGPSEGIDDEPDAELPIDTAERLKALGDPLRLAIVDLVQERAMTVSELAERLDRPRGTMAYHVDVLVEAGLLRVVRTRRVRAIEERYYGRTATTYVLPSATDELPFLREVLTDIDLERADEPGLPGITTYRHARIPLDRAEEFERRLLALALEFVAAPRGGDTEFGLYLALFPTNRRIAPRRRARPETGAAAR